jgi:hypothetical protein
VPPVLPHPLDRRRHAVALASHLARAEIEPLLASLCVDITFVMRIELLSARVESGCPEILIIDTDLLGLPDELCRMARSLRPDVVTVALVNHWSDREQRLKGVVDAVLHKPARREEWQQLFG